MTEIDIELVEGTDDVRDLVLEEENPAGQMVPMDLTNARIELTASWRRTNVDLAAIAYASDDTLTGFVQQIEILDPPNEGKARVTFRSVDLLSGVLFYRIDVVRAGARSTPIAGRLQVRAV